MSTSPRISVIIPAYNQGAFLSEALDSVLAQTYSAHEVLVIDDGSTDDTPTLLERYRGRVVTVRQANAGVCAARNNGLDRATGDWIAFLDSDDIWEPRKLERQVQAVEGEDVVCVHTAYRVFGNVQGEQAPPEEVLQGRYDLAALLTKFMVVPSSALVRHDTSLRFHRWAAVCEDALYFAELSRRGRFVFLAEPLLAYRKHGASTSGRAARAAEGWANRFRWVEEHSGLGSEERDRLEEHMGRAIADEAVLARWLRDWPRYWKLRGCLASRWRWPDPPAVLGERVYPRLLYRLKDAVDRLLRRGRSNASARSPQRGRS